jgi:Rhomboid family
MLSYWFIGMAVERRYGTLAHIGQVATFVLLSNILYVLIGWIGIRFFDYRSASLGFSGVIFALLMVETGLQPPGTSRSIFGVVSVPTWVYPWVLLLILSIAFSNVSFIGHLCGILVGWMFAKGLLNFLTFKREWIIGFEQRMSFLSNLPMYVKCPAQPPIALPSWAPPAIGEWRCCGSGTRNGAGARRNANNNAAGAAVAGGRTSCFAPITNACSRCWQATKAQFVRTRQRANNYYEVAGQNDPDVDMSSFGSQMDLPEHVDRDVELAHVPSALDTLPDDEFAPPLARVEDVPVSRNALYDPHNSLGIADGSAGSPYSLSPIAASSSAPIPNAVARVTISPSASSTHSNGSSHAGESAGGWDRLPATSTNAATATATAAAASSTSPGYSLSGNAAASNTGAVQNTAKKSQRQDRRHYNSRLLDKLDRSKKKNRDQDN